MHSKKIHVRLLLLPVVLLGLYTTLFFISDKGAEFPELYPAIAADLLVIAPMIYLGLIWKTSIPKVTVVPVTIFGLLFGYWILPAQGHSFLDIFKQFVLPFVELGALTFIGIKLFKLQKKTKKLNNEESDFYNAIRKASSEVLPGKAGTFFAVEIATLYYALFKWRSREKTGFTYHQKSTTTSIFIAIVLIIIAESFTLHYFAAKLSTTFAWTLTIISLYTLLQFVGWAKSLPDRPHIVQDNVVHLRFGMAREVAIPLGAISLIQHNEEEHEDAKHLSMLGKLDLHNMYLETTADITIHTLYGFKTRTRKLVFFADAPEELIQAIERTKNSIG